LSTSQGRNASQCKSTELIDVQFIPFRQSIQQKAADVIRKGNGIQLNEVLRRRESSQRLQEMKKIPVKKVALKNFHKKRRKFQQWPPTASKNPLHYCISLKPNRKCTVWSLLNDIMNVERDTKISLLVYLNTLVQDGQNQIRRK
jgi:hypothetical protein